MIYLVAYPDILSRGVVLVLSWTNMFVFWENYVAELDIVTKEGEGALTFQEN